MDHAALDKSAWAAGIAGGWSPDLYFFADDYRDGAHLHARFSAPADGVDEDPATGSACASLVAGVAQRSPERDNTHRLQIDQGVAMGRPSLLEGTAYKQDGRLTEVVVTGRRHHHRQRHHHTAHRVERPDASTAPRRPGHRTCAAARTQAFPCTSTFSGRGFIST